MGVLQIRGCVRERTGEIVNSELFSKASWAAALSRETGNPSREAVNCRPCEQRLKFREPRSTFAEV